jgi:hypothetical protein
MQTLRVFLNEDWKIHEKKKLSGIFKAGVFNLRQTWAHIHSFLLTRGRQVINKDNLLKSHGSLLKMLLN